MIRVAGNERCFEQNGKPFFYLADTIWSAFTNISFEEWEYYLRQRRFQGFNVLQINTLPQWDRSEAEEKRLPYHLDNGDIIWHEDYFERAQKMCQMAVDKGFELALVLLWCNYVPDTWASRMQDKDILAFELLDPLVQKLYETFDAFQPIYIISGDTDFDTEQSIAYYDKVLTRIKELSPDTLKTLHIKGRLDEIPQKLADQIDFYMYQSGHNVQDPSMPYFLAQQFYNKYPAKPILNSEPCYEQMGYSRRMYGRFSRRDVRRAAWMSVLSGACGGITYGAHGVWSWHKTGKAFASLLGEGFDAPMPWEDAIKLPGAWDYGYLKYIFATYRLDHMIPVMDLCENNTDDIRVAGSEDQQNILIYVPSNTTIRLNKDLSEYEIVMIDLCNKNILYPEVSLKEGKTLIQMHNLEEDVLIICQHINDEY